MARRRTVRNVSAGYNYGHFWTCGLFVFLFGLILNQGYGFDVAFMAIGILIILKSLIMNRM